MRFVVGYEHCIDIFGPVFYHTCFVIAKRKDARDRAARDRAARDRAARDRVALDRAALDSTMV